MIPKYNREKYYRIMDITQSNYANQIKRISKDSKRADFILIYYSLSLIIYSLSVKFYPDLFDEDWTSYSSIILSIIVLVYSIINSKAQYPERIHSLEKALNKTKWIKREVGSLPGDGPQNCSLSCPECQKVENGPCAKLDALKKEYDDLVNSTEIRDDIDFYYTIQHLCKQHHIGIFTRKYKGSAQDERQEDIIREIKGYISENMPLRQNFHIWIKMIWHFSLYILPVVILILSIVFKHFSVLSAPVDIDAADAMSLISK